MAIQKNMGPKFRIFYLILGAALVASPFVTPIEGWLRIVLPVMGGMAIVAGGVGL